MTRRQVLAGLGSAAPLLFGQAEEAARKAADNWLAVVDQGKYQDAYNQSSRHSKEQATSEEWGEQVRSLRAGTGAVQQRSFTSGKATNKMAGAPDGEFMLLEYSTSFAKKAKSVETLMLSHEDGNWKACGYHIR